MKLSAISRTLAALLLALLFSVTSARAYNQDHFFLYKQTEGRYWINGLAIGPDDKIYVAEYSNYVLAIYDQDLTLLARVSLPYRPHDVDVASDGTVYVTYPDVSKAAKFDSAGNSLGDFAVSSGINPHYVRIHPTNGNIYFKDNGGGYRVYQPDGTLVKSFGLSDGTRSTVLPDGRLHLCNGNIWNDQNIMERSGVPSGQDIRYAAGQCYSANEYYGGWFNIYNADFTSIYQYAGPWWRQSNWGYRFGINRKGDFIGTDSNIVFLLRRCEGNSMGPEVRNSPPIPEVISVAQRPNTTLLDIEFKVTDMDDPAVQVAAAAFTTNTNSLDNMILLNSLLESTGTNLGSAIATGSTHKLTWDVGADWGADFGDVSVHIFARDSRQGLMGLHFLDLPGEGPVPIMKITRSPVHVSWFLEPLMWLAASKNPSVTFTSVAGVGSILAVGGEFDGKLLATGTSVTLEGRQFVEALMGVHEATAQQIQWAREAATPGNVNAWDMSNSTYQRIDLDRPRRVNEYGFDTGDYDANWFWLLKN